MVDDAPVPAGDALVQVEFFADLSAEARAEVAAIAQPLQLAADATLFRQGDEAKRFFVVLDGRIKLVRTTPEGHQMLVRYAGPGDLVGCVPLFEGGDYPATASAALPSRLLAWDADHIDDLLARHPGIARNALRLLGHEIGELRQRLQELAAERVEQRIARALVRLVRQGGERIEEGVLIDFPVSRQDLAELTGTTLHSVSRVLSAWQERGIIDGGRRRIIIRRPHALVGLAEDLDH